MSAGAGALQSQGSPFFLSVFPGSQLAVTQLPLEGRMPIDDVVHQAGALQLPLVANRQPSRRCGVQDDHTDFTVRCQDSSLSLHNLVKRRGKIPPSSWESPQPRCQRSLWEFPLGPGCRHLRPLRSGRCILSPFPHSPDPARCMCAPPAVVIFLHAIHTLQAFAAAGNEVAGIGLDRRDRLVLGSPNRMDWLPFCTPCRPISQRSALCAFCVVSYPMESASCAVRNRPRKVKLFLSLLEISFARSAAFRIL